MQILLMVRQPIQTPEMMLKGEVAKSHRFLLLRVSVSCIVVAILGYGMMSMYWCCRLSFESGCCSVSWPWGEVARDRAHGSLDCQRPYAPPIAGFRDVSSFGDAEQPPDAIDSQQHQYMLTIP